MESISYACRQTIVVSVAILVGLAGVVVYLLMKPATHECLAWQPASTYRTHPRRVVIRPWLGQHHVFGVFMIPHRYMSDRTYSGIISVESFIAEFSPHSRSLIERAEGEVADPGHNLVRVYIPTRVALWFIAKGQFGDLRMPCNWTLELKKRTSDVGL